MGITFSMTLLALVLASGQYTSRILRNFMRSRVTQAALGGFASIFAYCLIVLRTIRGSGGVHEFVPSPAVFFAFVMSTFIATLGFDSPPVHLQSAKSSILVASLFSAILGVLYIRFVAAKKHNASRNSTPKSGAN
jgi:uncharacterized membrane protein